MLLIRTALPLSLCLFACDDASPDASCTPVGGDVPPRVVNLFQRTIDGQERPVPDGGTVDLIRPIQGGHVLWVSARVTGLCTEDTTTFGRIRQPGGPIVVQEERTGIDLTDRGDGTASVEVSEPGDMANLALCPDHLGYQIDGSELELELTITDAEGRVATAKVRARPTCPPGDAHALCACECAANGDEMSCGG